MSDKSMPNLPRSELVAIALTRHHAGESLRTIAADLGTTHTSLRTWLMGEVPDEYKSAQQHSFITRIVESDEELDNADNALSIARAREKAKFARWDAERRLPHLFGAKHEQHGGSSINVIINQPSNDAGESARVTIDHAP